MTTIARGTKLDIRLLGPPEVRVDGVPLVVDTRKAVAILALLATDGRPYARDELAALLWPESDDASARGALRRTLSTLHAAVGDGPLDVGRDRVALVGPACRVDLADLERLAASDVPDDLRAAGDLVRGPFLAGFSLRDSVEFDDWRAARAAAIERTVLGVLDRLTVAREAAGDLPGAIEAAARRLDRDPLDETAHVRLMDLYAATGDRSAALRQYRACVAVLERELGVAPLETTTARYEVIRDAPEREATTRPTAPATPSDERPAHVTPSADRPVPPTRPRLVGRDDVLAEALRLHAVATSGAAAVLAFIGEAGIGKSAVGDAIAARVREGGGFVLSARAFAGERGIAYGPLVEAVRTGLALPDGALRVEGLDASTREELARLLPSIDPTFHPADARDAAAHLRLVAALADGLTAMAAGPVAGLVWIDDLQWADAATLETLAYLARRLVGRRLLLLLAWRPEDLDDDGVAFATRIGLMPGATVSPLGRLSADDVTDLAHAALGPEADPRAISRLFELSEGLPLYVVEALAAGGGTGDLAMPPNVRAVLHARLSGIGEPAGQVLTAASVIGRSFDLATVRYASGRSEEESVDGIDDLLRRGLIREDGPRYDFVHGALRDLAYESTSLARRRLLHRRIAEALRLDLGRSGRDDLGRLVSIGVHEREAGRDAEAAAAFRVAGARAAAVFANREAIELDEDALALGDPDPIGLHVELGRLRTRVGDYRGAITALEAAAGLAGPADLASIEWALGRVHLRRGDLAAARHHLDAAFAVARSDDPSRARILVDRSVAHRRAGDPARALEDARSALDAAERAGDGAAAGAAHRMSGLIALDRGDTAAATTELRVAVDAATEDADPTARIAALVALAMATASGGDIDEALASGDEAVETCRRIGDRHLEAAVENHIADLLHAAGRDDAAMPHLRRAVEAFAEVGGDPADPDPGIWMLAAS